MIVQAPVSVGELLDKKSILRVKLRNMKDPERLANVRVELAELERVTVARGLSHNVLEAELDEVNTALWTIEDELRVLEQRQQFDGHFIKLARSVYFTNDRRAHLKRQLNDFFGSQLVEEKEYVDYAGKAAPDGRGSA